MKRPIHIVVKLDEEPEYVYQVELGATLREIEEVHDVTHVRAYDMLLQSDREHPVQGKQCKFWRE